MKLFVCAVFDHAVGAYMPPLFFRSRGEAVRSFVESCNSKESNLWKFAKDYTFFFLALYDDASGAFENPGSPEPLMKALDALVFDDGVEVTPPSSRPRSVM